MTNSISSTPAYISDLNNLSILEQFENKKLTIIEAKGAVFKRIAEHSGHGPSFGALVRVDWSIRNLFKPTSRLELLVQLATMPLTDVIELNYLLQSKRFFKHLEKFNLFYKNLKIKNIKNKHLRIHINSSNVVPAAKLTIRINHATINTSAQSNFLLDFGFVESVGSVLLLLKDY